jgi:hypothetical protein
MLRNFQLVAFEERADVTLDRALEAVVSSFKIGDLDYTKIQFREVDMLYIIFALKDEV